MPAVHPADHSGKHDEHKKQHAALKIQGSFKKAKVKRDLEKHGHLDHHRDPDRDAKIAAARRRKITEGQGDKGGYTDPAEAKRRREHRERKAVQQHQPARPHAPPQDDEAHKRTHFDDEHKKQHAALKIQGSFKKLRAQKDLEPELYRTITM